MTDAATPKAMAFLVRSTGQRPLTVAEARQKLAARQHDEALIDAVVARARVAGVLDDRAFAAAWVNDRGVNRGYGRDRLRRELQRRLVEEDVIDVALSVLDDHDQALQATELARVRARRMSTTDDPRKVAGRLAGFLVRRGFSSDVAHQVAREVTALDRLWD